MSSGEKEKSLSVFFLPDAEEARYMETNFELETPEQDVCPPKAFSDGNLGHNPPDSEEALLGHDYRLKGCLPAHSDTSALSQVPSIQVQGDRLLFQGSSVWPFNVSKGLYQSYQGSPGLFKKQRNNRFRLSRRLAFGGRVRGGMCQNNKLHGFPPRGSRLGRQSREIFVNSVATGDVSRRVRRLRGRKGGSYAGKSVHFSEPSVTSVQRDSVQSQVMASSVRTYGEFSGHPSSVSPVHETNPISSTSPLHPVCRRLDQVSSGDRGSQTSFGVVDASTQCDVGNFVLSNDAVVDHYDRCLPVRLGCGLELRDSVGSLGNVTSTTYQPSRDGRSVSSPCTLGSPSQRSPGNGFMRQHCHCVLHKSPRRDQVSILVSKDLESSSLVSESGHLTSGFPSGGTRQRDGRCSVQRDTSGDGMGTVPGMGESRVRDFRQASSGPLCFGEQRQTSDLCFQVLSPSVVDGRRSGDFMGRPSGVRFSSMVPPVSGSTEAQAIEDRPSTSGSLLAESPVVPVASGNARRPPVSLSTETQPPDSETREDLAPASTISPSFCLAVVNKRLQGEGLPSETAKIAAGSRRRSTTATYDSRLQRFTSWAESNGVNPLEASVSQLADFFMTLYREGKQVSTIRNYRSAISAVHSGFSDGSTLGSSSVISQLLRGMFNERPPQKRLAPSWSINDVLASLATSPYEPMHEAPLEQLTFKTVFLVAAASARRRSELHALTSQKGFIRFDPDGVHLLPDPSFLAKNQSPSFSPQEIYLPSIASTSTVREDRVLCPVRALKWYLARTKPVRKSSQLFLIPRRPYAPASKDTLSRWIVQLIRPHAQPEERVKAHDVRAHAASRAWFKGVGLEDILRAAAWKTPSTFVASYLTNVVSSDGSFARAALGLPIRRVPGLPSSLC